MFVGVMGELLNHDKLVWSALLEPENGQRLYNQNNLFEVTLKTSKCLTSSFHFSATESL